MMYIKILLAYHLAIKLANNYYRRYTVEKSTSGVVLWYVDWRFYWRLLQRPCEWLYVGGLTVILSRQTKLGSNILYA